MSWRFLRTAKWVVRHVAVVILVVVMANLGLWQLRRLDEARAARALLEQRQEAPAVAVTALVPRDAPVDSAAVEEVLYRRVTSEGTYEDRDTVVVENRSLGGSSGAWVLTPLRLADGSAVVVNRGFLRFNRDGVILPPAAPSGTVKVAGILQPSQQRGRFGPTDPATGRVEVLARVDLDRIEAQVDYDLLPVYVQAASSEPEEDEVPEGDPAIEVLGPPEIDEGPHLSYAVQWFIFTTIAAVGYGLVLRRVARDQAREERAGLPDH